MALSMLIEKMRQKMREKVRKSKTRLITIKTFPQFDLLIRPD